MAGTVTLIRPCGEIMGTTAMPFLVGIGSAFAARSSYRADHRFFAGKIERRLRSRSKANLGKVHIINTHLGLGWRERFVQAQLFTTAEWRAAIASDIPVILLGDFNSLRGSQPYRTLNRHLRDVRELIQATGPIGTFPTRFPMLAVDHIFVNGSVEPVSLTVHRSPLARIASDHFPLMAEFVRSPRHSPE